MDSIDNVRDESSVAQQVAALRVSAAIQADDMAATLGHADTASPTELLAALIAETEAAAAAEDDAPPHLMTDADKLRRRNARRAAAPRHVVFADDTRDDTTPSTAAADAPTAASDVGGAATAFAWTPFTWDKTLSVERPSPRSRRGTRSLGARVRSLATHANIQGVDAHGNNMLHMACMEDSIPASVVSELCAAGVRVNVANFAGDTPLMVAVAHDAAHKVRALLDHGAQTIHVGADFKTALHIACTTKSHDDACVALLCDAKDINLNAVDAQGYTPLHYATQQKGGAVVRTLCERGAAVHVQNKEGVTPLHLASLLNRVDVTRMLLRAGADPLARNALGETCIMSAVRWGEYDSDPPAAGGERVVRDDDARHPPPPPPTALALMLRALAKRGAGEHAHQPDVSGNSPLQAAIVKHKHGHTHTLLRAGAALTHANTLGETPLHTAALVGSAPAVNALLAAAHARGEAAACLRARDGNVNTPTHTAAERGHMAALSMLLGASSDGAATAWSVNVRGDLPLHAAIRARAAGTAYLLLESMRAFLTAEHGEGAAAAAAAANTPTAFGVPPLHMAIVGKSRDIVRMLLHFGADANVSDEGDAAHPYTTPLHRAAYVRDEDMVAALLERGARVDDAALPRTKMGTPLHVAAARNAPLVARALLHAGCDVDAEDAGGNTPLHTAAAHSHVDIIRILLHSGASVNAPNAQQNTPLHVATTQRCTGCLHALLRTPDVVVNARNVFGATPLHFAAARGDADILVLLMDAGANVHAADAEAGATPLHIAASKGHAAAVDTLLAGGADVDARTSRAQTALHIAAGNGFDTVVHALLRGGASVRATAEDNVTPLHAAVDGGHEACVDTLLQQRDVDVDAHTSRAGVTPLHVAAARGNARIITALLRAGADVLVVNREGLTAADIAEAAGQTDASDMLMTALSSSSSSGSMLPPPPPPSPRPHASLALTSTYKRARGEHGGSSAAVGAVPLLSGRQARTPFRIDAEYTR